eukprot:COSAG02_NODE_45218_length_359_cov_0.773077_2_plen_38_part_01
MNFITAVAVRLDVALRLMLDLLLLLVAAYQCRHVATDT